MNNWRRVLVLFLVALLIMVTGPAPQVLAQSMSKPSSAPPPAMPAHVKKGPKGVTIFTPQLHFSIAPTDLELSTARVFLEPLAATSGASVVGENAALAQALLKFKARKNIEDLSALIGFIQKYPNSRWRASLELNLGQRCFETGYFSDALAHWKNAWIEAKNEKSGAARIVADDAISQIVLIEARLGRTTELAAHLKEAKTRRLYGSTAARVHDASTGLMCMNERSDIAFKCGPFSLNSIINARSGKRNARNVFLTKVKSTKKGTNLAQLQDWAVQVGLKYVPARRAKGKAALIVPSVVHWKSGHFAAIVSQHQGRYHVLDGTFGEKANAWLSKEAFNNEGDGYYLVPAGSLPAGWSAVSKAEAQNVWGKGDASTKNGGKTKAQPKINPGPSCPSGGMATAYAWSMQASLNIVDTPLSYRTPIGPLMSFLINYNDLEGNQPSSFAFANVGPNWSLNWVSYLTLDASSNATVSVRGGGYEQYDYTLPDNVSNPYPPDLNSQAILTVVGDGIYQRQLPDGSIEVFNQPDSTGRIFMTQVIDPQGNATSITYDANFRITAITDPLGQVSTPTYVSNTSGSQSFYTVASIADPFGRSCSFNYQIPYSGAPLQLLSSTDVIGLISQFVYDTDTLLGDSSFITQMTTPYGTTFFNQYIRSDGLGDAAVGLQFFFRIKQRQ